MRFLSWKTAAGSLALGALLALGGASSAEAKGDLVLKRFLIGRLEDNTLKFVATGARGTQNAFRDNVLMLVFSAPVNMSTLDNRTVKVGIPAGGGLFIDADGSYYPYKIKEFNSVTGTFEDKRIYKNRVLFDPTKRNDDENDRNPYGFEENSLYTVTIPGLDSGTTKVVRGADGGYNERTFTTNFRTTDKYLQDYKQPHITEVVASDAPLIALDGRANVDSRADIIARFSEPMLPAAFDPTTTFRVFNFGQNRVVSGVIRPAPDGLSFTFRPAFGYGRGPYNVQVTLSSSLSDRSGNPLDKGAVVNFVTELDLLAPNYEEIVEGFDTRTFEDTSYQAIYDKATWNGSKAPSSLAGTFGSKSLDIIVTTAANGDGIPLWTAQAHTQNLYSAAQMGNTARTVNGFAWRYYTLGVPVAASYPNMTVQMGHNTSTSLNVNYTGSFSDVPVTVFNTATYTVPTSVPEWVVGPTWTANWAYNGRDGVVLDINNPNGGTNVNYWRYTTAAQGGITKIRGYSGGAASALTWGNDVRFFYLVDRSEAQSLWYDTDQNNPGYLDPIFTQTTPPGTVTSVVFQGARENPVVPNTPDLTTISAWTSDPLNDLSGFRFIRFHADLTSNLGSSTRPTIEELKIPFIFY